MTIMMLSGQKLATSLLVCVLVISSFSTSCASTINYANAVKAGTTSRPNQDSSAGVQTSQPAETQITRLNSTLSQATTTGRTGYCQINIKRTEELPRILPLILHPHKLEFLHPQTSQAVRIDSSHHVRLVCPGEDNVLSLTKGTTQRLQNVSPVCVRRSLFNAREIQAADVTVKDLGCDKEYSASAVPTGEACFGKKYSRIQIGFEVPARPKKEFVPTMDLCFDQANYDAVYSTVKLTPSIQYRQWEVTRPEEFAAGPFFGSIGILQLYQRYKQRETFTTILGSRQLAEKYIPRDADTKYFLARGHLAAMTDFIYGAEQRSTFFYMNVAPQWQIFNDGNWKDLEISVRNFATQRNSAMTLYTGTWGTSMLEDKNGKLQPLHLYVDTKNNKRGVKVPAYFWKVLYDPVTQEGAAFVGINNPFLKNVGRQDVFCTDICDNFKWLQLDAHNIQKGYTFCCSVEDFRKTVNDLPDFPVKSTFTPDSKNCKTYDGCNKPYMRNRPHGHGG